VVTVSLVDESESVRMLAFEWWWLAMLMAGVTPYEAAAPKMQRRARAHTTHC